MRHMYLVISIVLSLTIVSASFAADVSISASVDKKNVSVGDMIEYTIHVQGVQAIPAPKLPNINGFQSQYAGPSTRMSIVNGQTTVYVEHRYYLTAVRRGTFTIPSISVRYADKLHRTKPIKVKVTSRSGAAQKNTMTAEELKKYLRLDIITKKNTAYINEGIPVLIRLYIRSGIQVENISRRPALSSVGFSVAPFGDPVQRQTNIEGIRFTTIDFSTTAYPVKSGELTLGPAALECRILARPNRNRFRRARYKLTRKSEPQIFTVKPLPTAGQPANFSGLVGQFDLDVEAKPLSLKVGEPITLTMTVRGAGNIDAAKIPEIADLTQFKIYDPQISVNKGVNTGVKTFEQVLIPKSANVEAIPEIRLSYFDPEEGQYKTKTKGPIRVKVAPPDEEGTLQILEVAGGKAVRREILGKDIFYIKDEIGSAASGGRLYKNKGFLLLQLLPLAGFAGVLVYQKRRDRFATDRTYARQYHAPRKAKKGFARAQDLIASGQTQEFCSTIFKVMQEYLGDRFNLPCAGITIEIVDSLRTQGFTEEMLEKLTAFFHACDRTRFAGSEMDKNEMTEILHLAKESIRFLETSKSAT